MYVGAGILHEGDYGGDGDDDQHKDDYNEDEYWWRLKISVFMIDITDYLGWD